MKCSHCLCNHSETNCINTTKYWVASQNGENAILSTASRDFIVIYAGQVLQIKAGEQFYQRPDSKQVVVGWHGSILPPTDMDGRTLIK